MPQPWDGPYLSGRGTHGPRFPPKAMQTATGGGVGERFPAARGGDQAKSEATGAMEPINRFLRWFPTADMNPYVASLAQGCAKEPQLFFC